MNMARGKIQMKRIENSTNRQVAFSKRRNGLFKKARELTVLCDAKVSIILCSSTGKVYEYISPSTTTKHLLDEYQKTLKIDLWSSKYEKMQEDLKHAKEVNGKLRKEIGQRLGENLNDLSLKELYGLQQDIDNCLRIIREQKDKVLLSQINTWKRKVNSLERQLKNLQSGFIINAKEEDPNYDLVDNGGHYDTVIGLRNEGLGIFISL